MSRITQVDAQQPGRELKRILDSSLMTLEDEPNFLKVLANSAAALKAYVESDKALLNGQLTPRFREQIALAVAEINDSKYCLVAHSVASNYAGLTGEEVEMACHATASDPKSQALLHFTQAIVLQRGKISDADFCALGQAGFSQSELVEVIANIVHNIFSNYLNLVARTEIDLPTLPPDAGVPRHKIRAGSVECPVQSSVKPLRQSP